MRVLLSSAALLLLVSLLTVLVIFRRGGRAGDDLLASQMRAVTGTQPVGSSSSSTGTPPRPDRQRRVDQHAPDLPGIDDQTWRRIGKLAVAGHRVQAIELLRSVSGCRLTEAKAVVDRLSLAGRGPTAQDDRLRNGARSAASPGRRGVSPPSPGRRPVQFPPGLDLVAGQPGEATPSPADPMVAADAHRLLQEVRDLAYRGSTTEAIQLLQDGAGMSRHDAEEAVGRLTAASSDE